MAYEWRLALGGFGVAGQKGVETAFEHFAGQVGHAEFVAKGVDGCDPGALGLGGLLRGAGGRAPRRRQQRDEQGRAGAGAPNPAFVSEGDVNVTDAPGTAFPY